MKISSYIDLDYIFTDIDLSDKNEIIREIIKKIGEKENKILEDNKKIENEILKKEEDISKLFRIDVNHTTIGTKKEAGTGLGLIICKEFAEIQGGRLFIESSPGKGSTIGFSIKLNPN